MYTFVKLKPSTNKSNTVRKGTKVTIKGYKYTVKNSSEVTFTGVKNKKAKTITVKSTKLKSVGKNAFKGINSKAKIKVPAKKYSAYKKLFKGKGQGKKVKIVKVK